MAGIPHFGGCNQGRICTVGDVIKKTSCKGLANVVLKRNHALAYEPMANITGCFHGVNAAFDFDLDSQDEAANRLVKRSTISTDVSLIQDLNDQY